MRIIVTTACTSRELAFALVANIMLSNWNKRFLVHLKKNSNTIYMSSTTVIHAK